MKCIASKAVSSVDVLSVYDVSALPPVYQASVSVLINVLSFRSFSLVGKPGTVPKRPCYLLLSEE